MYQLFYKGQFKRDLKKIKKRSARDFNAVRSFVEALEKSGSAGVSASNKPHRLKGNYAGHWEAHIKPDLLIIWQEENKNLILELVRTGTHSDLF